MAGNDGGHPGRLTDPAASRGGQQCPQYETMVRDSNTLGETCLVCSPLYLTIKVPHSYTSLLEL